MAYRKCGILDEFDNEVVGGGYVVRPSRRGVGLWQGRRTECRRGTIRGFDWSDKSA